MKTFTIHPKLVFFIISLITLRPSFITAQTPVFYAMTYRGGSVGNGAIIMFDPANDSESVVWSFGSGTDGQSPYEDLVYDSNNGLFYGMTNRGGTNGDGTIISFNPANDSENVVWNFGTGTDGKDPYGNLVYDTNNGLFYGMTYSGGNGGFGVIFTFDPTSDSENVVWNFGSAPDAEHPSGDLVYNATTGLYYGLAADGGSQGSYGAIFSFNTATNKDSVLWSFGPTEGWGPGGDLTYDATTSLFYAMTQYGGSNGTNSGDGTIISFDLATDKDSVVWNFGSGTDGKNPDRSLVYNSTYGLFYGMTNIGGTYADGTIISFNPASDSEMAVWSFAGGTDGENPFGNLAYDAGTGLYYGTTFGGGSNGSGTIISFNPANDSEKVVWNFGSGTDGASPKSDLVLYPANVSGINTIRNTAATISIYPNPTNGNFTITALSKGQIVDLYNDLGQKISSVMVDNSTQQLDISAQANGIYVVRVLNNDGSPAGEEKVLKVN